MFEEDALVGVHLSLKKVDPEGKGERKEDAEERNGWKWRMMEEEEGKDEIKDQR